MNQNYRIVDNIQKTERAGVISFGLSLQSHSASACDTDAELSQEWESGLERVYATVNKSKQGKKVLEEAGVATNDVFGWKPTDLHENKISHHLIGKLYRYNVRSSEMEFN